MTEPPLPDDVRQDLILPFGPIPDALGRDVILSADHADAVLAYCRAIGSKFGAPGYLRYLFGLPINQALLSGYLITQRALRRRLRTPVRRRSPAPPWNSCRVLTAAAVRKTGGSSTYSPALARWRTPTRRSGCRVQAVDNDRTTVDVGVHNMAHAGSAGLVDYHLADGPATLASAVSAGRKIRPLIWIRRGEAAINMTWPCRSCSRISLWM